MPELFVVGKPAVSVVAFGSKRLNIFAINQYLSKKGWSVNALQNPNAIHIAVTLMNHQFAKVFIDDLKEAIYRVANYPQEFTSGSAVIYGLSTTRNIFISSNTLVPDREIIGDLAKSYMDILYE